MGDSPKDANRRRRSAIAKRLAKFRASAGISLATAADRVGTTPWTWMRWERGATSVPAEAMPAIAAALEVTIADLLGVELLDVAA